MLYQNTEPFSLECKVLQKATLKMACNHIYGYGVFNNTINPQTNYITKWPEKCVAQSFLTMTLTLLHTE